MRGHGYKPSGVAMNSSEFIRLPRIICNGMVLQRRTTITIWGFSPAGYEVLVQLFGVSVLACADENGLWEASFETGEGGGPFTLVVRNRDATERITVQDVWVGDIWLCSGQSNMDMRMESVQSVFPEEFVKNGYITIRQFSVPVTADFNGPQNDLPEGSWVTLNAETIVNFGAVGYFFAQHYRTLNPVPIGLIQAALGGAPAEAFMSEEGLAHFPRYLHLAKKYADSELREKTLRRNDTNSVRWHQRLDARDIGICGHPFFDPDTDTTDWDSTYVPSWWDDSAIGPICGAVWYRRTILVPQLSFNVPICLHLGNICDEDTVYLNGVRVGASPSQYMPRQYYIPEGLLKEGSNTIVIKVVSGFVSGGFYPGKPYCLQIGSNKILLDGEWQYRVGAVEKPMPVPIFVNWHPTGLYNGMIAPLHKMAIKGVLWYQGETNAQYPNDYAELFAALIRDWRTKWQQGDFPFLFAQLPNYQERHPGSSGHWAQIRDAQRQALTLPHTGMAITLDIGEWNDIHPVNKRDVGIRLASIAERASSQEKGQIASGPIPLALRRDENRLIITFSETGKGLYVKGGYQLEGFEIAGENGVFLHADAELRHDEVIVRNRDLFAPNQVRYAWSDNPVQANLYRLDGMPTSTFRLSLLTESL